MSNNILSAPTAPTSAASNSVAGLQSATHAGEAQRPGADRSESLLGNRQGDFVLRINAGPQAGRTIRLSSAKCTIGSAANCTLRLRGKGIEPVHCVVLHGARQTIVRRWASDTFINDHRFEDETLRAGDRLAIGALEFQIVALPGRPQPAIEPARNRELEAKLDKLQVARLTERLALANRQARRRLRAVIGKLRKFQIRMSELEMRRRTNTHEQEQLAAEKARLEAFERDLSARAGELDQKRAATKAEDHALVEQAERLRNASKQWNQDRAAAQQELDRRRLEIDAASARLAGETARLEAERTELASRLEAHTRRQEEWSRRDEELNVRADVLERSVIRLQEERREIEGRAADLNAVAEQQADRDAELAQIAASFRSSTADFEARIAERERLIAEREVEIAARTKKLLERERNEVARAQTQADALARQWAVIQAVSDEQQRKGSLQSSGSEEMQARHEALEAQAAELAKSAQALESQAADIAQRRAALIDSSRELDTRAASIAAQESTLQRQLAEHEAIRNAGAAAGAEQSADWERRESELLNQRSELARQSEAVARSCESLKQNWSELNERERKLADREAACRAAEATLAEQVATLATTQAAPVMAPVVAQIDGEEIARLKSELTDREEALRLLNERCERLTIELSTADGTSDADQVAAERDALAAEKASLAAELEAERAKIAARDAEAQAGQAAMLEATTLYETKLTELTVELEILRAARDERSRELSDNQAACEALTREMETLRAELADRERAVEAATAELANAELATDERATDDSTQDVRLACEATAESSYAPADIITPDEIGIEPTAVAHEEEVAQPVAQDDSAEPANRDEESAELASTEEAAEEPTADDVAAQYESAAEEESASAPVVAAAEAPRPASSGESAADVLRRMGLASVLEDDDQGSKPAPQRAPEPPRPAPQPARAPEPAAAEHDEDSLNDYMAQLMARLGVQNQGGAAKSAAAASTSSSPAHSSAPMASAAATPQKPAEPAAPLAPLQASEFKARSVAAERASDLSALRALANQNARTAITTHQIKTTTTASKWKKIVAASALVVGCVGAYFHFTGHKEGYNCMVAGVLVAVAFYAQSIGLKKRAKSTTRSLDDVLNKSNAKMNAENEAAEAARKA